MCQDDIDRLNAPAVEEHDLRVVELAIVDPYIMVLVAGCFECELSIRWISAHPFSPYLVSIQKTPLPKDHSAHGVPRLSASYLSLPTICPRYDTLS